MKLSRRGNLWRVEWTDAHGRHRVSTGETDKVKAQAAAVRILSGEAQRYQPRATEGATLKAWLHRTYETVWRDTKSAYTCWCNIQTVERDEIADLPVARVDYDALCEFAQRLDAMQLSPATVNRRLSLISRALTEAHKAGAIRSKPPLPRAKEDNKREVCLTSEQETALLDAARDGDPYMALLIMFLTDTGARLSEALRVRLEDFDERSVLFPETKGGKPRRVPLSSRALWAVRRMVADPRHGATINKDWCIVRFRRLVQAAGLPATITLHGLRHTCASRLVRNGADLYRVKEWLGHSSVAVTERYAHLAPSSLSELVGLLGGQHGTQTGTRKEGIEEGRGFDWNLNPARLPVPPSRQ